MGEGSRGDLWRDPLARKISERRQTPPRVAIFIAGAAGPFICRGVSKAQGARCERFRSPQVASRSEAERRLAGLVTRRRAVAGVVAAAVPRAAVLRADEQQRG